MRTAASWGDTTGYPWHGGSGSPGTLWDGAAAAPVRDGQTWVNGRMVDPLSEKRPEALSVVSVVTTGDVPAQKVRDGLQRLALAGRPGRADRLRPAPRARASARRSRTTSSAPTAPTSRRRGPPPSPRLAASSAAPRPSRSAPRPPERPSTTRSTDRSPRASPRPTPVPSRSRETTTVKARAFLDGYEDSAVATASFVRAEDSPVVAADGLALWLRADAGIATNAGDWVTQWADQSGRGQPRLPDERDLGPSPRPRRPERPARPSLRRWGHGPVHDAADDDPDGVLGGVDGGGGGRGECAAQPAGGRARRYPWHGGNGSPGTIWERVRVGGGEGRADVGERGGGGGDDDAAADVSVGGVAGDDGERVRAEVRGGVQLARRGWGTWRS